MDKVTAKVFKINSITIFKKLNTVLSTKGHVLVLSCSVC